MGVACRWVLKDCGANAGGVAGVAGGVAEAAGGAALDPEDGVGVGGFEEELEVIADVGGALAQAGGLFDFAQAFEFAFEAWEGVEGAEVGVAARFEEVCAVDELAGGRGRKGRRGGRRRRAWSARGWSAWRSRWQLVLTALARSMDSVSRASSSKRALERAMPKYWLAMSSSSWASSKMTAAASGRMPASGAPAACCLMVRSAKKRWWLTMTMSDSSALRRMEVMKQCSQLGQVWPRQTSLRASSLCQSGGVFGEVVDLGAVAGFGGPLPLQDGVELRDLFEAGEERVVAQGVELLLAEVVGAALHVADLERAEERFEEGDVLEVELLLQIFGAGGDDDALLAARGRGGARAAGRRGFCRCRCRLRR